MTRKLKPYFKCRWCEMIFESVPVYMTSEEIDVAIKTNLLSATHACDDKRQGVGQLIGFWKL